MAGISLAQAPRRAPGGACGHANGARACCAMPRTARPPSCIPPRHLAPRREFWRGKLGKQRRSSQPRASLASGASGSERRSLQVVNFKVGGRRG